jgi:hypothetical protein
MNDDGAVPETFLEDFSDGQLTTIQVCEICGEGNYCESFEHIQEVVDMTDDAVPEEIDPKSEITRPMVRNVLGQYEIPMDDEITIVMERKAA